MIFALIFCSFPAETLANSTVNEITLTLYDSTMEGCDSAFDENITINSQPIKKLYIKTINDGDKVILKNNRNYNISAGVLLTVRGESSYALKKNGKNTVELTNLAKATLRELTDAGISSSHLDTTASGYYFLQYCITNGYAFVVQVRGSNVPLDYSALNAQLARIEDENGRLNTGIYYIENDCYNGKVYTKGGAWAALTKENGPYAKAKGTLTLQSEIEKAASDLSAAIDKLIPKTRANPTLLYDELNKKWEYVGSGIQRLGPGNSHIVVSEDNTTAVTWQPYSAAFNEGQEILASLYDNDGNPTDANKAELQERIEELTEILRDSVPNFVIKSTYESDYKYYLDNKERAFVILDKYNPSKYTESDYTSESWTNFINAYNALDNDLKASVHGTGSKAEFDVVHGFHSGHIKALENAVRSLVNSGEIILSSFTYVNNFAVRYPQSDHGDFIDVLHYDKNNASDLEYLKLTPGRTTAWNAIQDKIGSFDERTNVALYLETLNLYFKGTFMVFVDGEFVEMSNQPGTHLHNGENVKIVRLATPAIMVEASTGETTSDTKPYPTRSEDVFGDSIADIKMSVPTEVKVGEEIEFSATLTGAYSSNLGAPLSPENITLFVSKPYDNVGSLADAQPIINTGKKTDASGKLSYVFTEPGTYAVAMYCVEPDEPTLTDILGITTIGTYNSVKAGDFAIVTVTASENEAALLQSWSAKYLAEAKAYFDEFHDYDFAEGFYESKLTPAYETLKEHIASANTYKGLVDGYKVDFDALKALGGQALNHSSVIDDFRKRLSYIPEDEATLDSGYAELIIGIKTDFAAMNEHTKALLSPAEMERIAHIVEIDVSALKTQPRVTVNIGGQNLPYGGKIFWTSDTGGATYHGRPNLKYVITPNNDGTLPTPDYSRFQDWLSNNTLSAKARDHVFLQFYAPAASRSESKYWLMWSLDNQSWDEVPLKVIMNAEGAVLGDSTPTYLPYDYFVLEYVIPDDVQDGSTINIYLKTVSQTEYNSYLVDDIKGDAIAAVNAAYDEYSKATNADAAKLAQIKADALAKIEAATTEADVTNARKAAVAAMAAAVTASAGSESGVIEPEASFDAGKQVGTVSLIIENTTFNEAPFTGTIAKGTYPLCENDSMMTVVLKALEAKGFNWNGTKGNVGDAGSSTGNHDYSISYLGSINKGEGSNNKELGEFDGGRKSGWMGTLNDWFVNESFSAFTVESGRLESGDEIHIMYTCDLGADIGGSWTVGDTAIKNINFSTGKLAPAFDSSVFDYMLIIPSDSAKLKVDYAIRNMNFQSRIFLNYYNKESARYKKSDVLSVKSGDKLYIGVGDPSWPSMNSSRKGAKYIFSVCTLDDAIKALPAASTVKLGNYKTYVSQVEQLEATIKAYGYSGNTEKLTVLKEATVFYSGIDKAKELLAAVPKVEKLSKSDVSKVRAAKSAYDALSDEQKKYITVADASKYNAAVEWLETQGISTGGRIKGNDEVPEEIPVEQPVVEKVVETVKVEATVDSKGVAKAEVASKDVSAAVKSATETKADAIVIAPEIKGEAKEVKVNLPKAAVNEIAEKTTASLVIETKTASVEVPTAVLNEIAAQAGGASVEISVALKTADTAEVKEAIAVMGDKIGSDVVTENAAVAEITVVSGNEKITTFGGKSINASVSVDGKKGFTEGKKYLTLVISENGKRELLAGKCTLDASGKLTVGVEVGHLSTFVVLDKELKSFADADAHWSAKAVDFAVANGLMNGISDTAFNPNATLNRAMLVTVLYRLAGSPAASKSAIAAEFDDIEAGNWYTDAVLWAASNGIVTGKSETTFAPLDNITREQFATMLMRYCSFAGIDTGKMADLSGFTDNETISSYAKDALSWANSSGIITGRTETTIAPKGSATRGEAATMLMRFLQL